MHMVFRLDRSQLVALGVFLADCSKRGGRSVEAHGLVLGDDLPECACVGVGRLPLQEDVPGPQQQGPVHPEGVAHHPAQISRTKKQLTGFQPHIVQELVAGGHGGWVLGALVDQHVGGRGVLEQGEGSLDDLDVVYHLVRLDPAAGGQQQLGPAVLDPGGQLPGREPAEHQRVDGPDPGGGQHADHGEGQHGHEDDNPVALAHARVPHQQTHLADQLQQLPVAYHLFLLDHLRDPDQRPPRGVALRVPVYAALADVQLPVHEPPVERGARLVQDFARKLHPLYPLGLLSPELLPLLVAVGLAAGRVIRSLHYF